MLENLNYMYPDWIKYTPYVPVKTNEIDNKVLFENNETQNNNNEHDNE